ncbi:hypothetical protein VBM89_01135 [Mycoplasma sp. 1199]|uniref:hypothetical protein n=1 Tax=Mycoplasma sp. 1199 TaxID=3108526 RepID=UPI002B1E5AFB|nr:hypothetical protein [Mycoplasma sp. 1199]MEA4206112.1 hypothetical protein [Mycoplasma sp. 1199]
MNFNNNTSKLFVYKIESNKPLSFIKHSINVINLSEPEEFDVIKLNHTKLSNTLLDDGNVSNELFNSYTITGDSDLYNYLEVEPSKNIFYLFTFDSPYVTQFNEFYIIENKIDNMELNDVLEAYADITLTQLDYYKELHNIDFVIRKNNPVDLTTDNFVLKMNKGALINSINFLNDKDRLIKMDNRSQAPYMLTINPFNVFKNRYSLNFWSLANNNFYLLNEYLKNQNTIPQNEFLIFLKELISVTNTVKSGYKGLNEEAIKKFEEKNGKISDLKNWTDNAIKTKLNQYFVSGEFEKTNILKNYILAFSNMLITTYAWKGGLNDENFLYSPLISWYNNGEYKWFSYLYDVDNNGDILSRIKNTFLNNNTFMFNGSNVQLPILGESLTEIDYSSTPVEFNDKSYNYNWPFYLFLKPSGFKKLVEYSAAIDQNIGASTRSVIVPYRVMNVVIGESNNYPSERFYIPPTVISKFINDNPQYGGESIYHFYDFERYSNSFISVNTDLIYGERYNWYKNLIKGIKEFESQARYHYHISDEYELIDYKLASKWIRSDVIQAHGGHGGVAYTSSLGSARKNYINKWLKEADVILPELDKYPDKYLPLFDKNGNEISPTPGWADRPKDSTIGLAQFVFSNKPKAIKPHQFYETLNNTIFNSPDEFVKSVGLVDDDFQDHNSIVIHKENNDTVRCIEIRALWLDWIMVNDMEIPINNKPYNKIIFW